MTVADNCANVREDPSFISAATLHTTPSRRERRDTQGALTNSSAKDERRRKKAWVASTMRIFKPSWAPPRCCITHCSCRPTAPFIVSNSCNTWETVLLIILRLWRVASYWTLIFSKSTSSCPVLLSVGWTIVFVMGSFSTKGTSIAHLFESTLLSHSLSA